MIEFDKDIQQAVLQSGAGKQLNRRNEQLGEARDQITKLEDELLTATGQLTDARADRDKNHAHMTKYWTDWKASEDRVELLEQLLTESGVEVPARPEAVEA